MWTSVRLPLYASLMQLHLRCPVCGQQRTQRSFEAAGHHRLEALQLRGRGQGRGFARAVWPLTVEMLEFLAGQLERARQQVEGLLALAHSAAAPPPACTQCGGPLIWSTAGWFCGSCGLTFG